MFERFTDDARHVVVGAQEDARIRGHDHIGSEHILLALVRDRDSMASRVLESMGVDLGDVREQVDAAIGSGGSAPSGHIPFTPSAKSVLELAFREALQLQDAFIGTEHILLGVVREGEGAAARVLDALGAELAAIRRKVLELRAEQTEPPQAEIRTALTVQRGAPMAMMQTWGGPGGQPVPRCALCGRDEANVGRVLVAAGLRLCSECVHEAVVQLDALPADAPKLVRYRRPEIAPSDKDAAIAGIETAFDAVVGPLALPVHEQLPFVEGGDAARELLELLSAPAQLPVVVNDTSVERVRFLSETEAEVTLGTWLAGNPQPILRPVHAALEDGTWKVSRSTLEEFERLSRPFRRPPGF